MFSRYIVLEWEGKRSLVAQSIKHPDRYYWFGGCSYTVWCSDMIELAEFLLPVTYNSDDEDQIEIEYYRTYAAPQKGQISETGWLAPNGDFYPCEYGAHHSVARQIAASQYGDLENADQSLTDRGWRILQKGMLIRTAQPAPTQSQIDAIFSLSQQVHDPQVARYINYALRQLMDELNEAL